MEKSLEEKVNELYAWMEQQQINDQLVPKHVSRGQKTLTHTYTDSHGDTVVAPAPYAGTEIIYVNNERREIPYI